MPRSLFALALALACSVAPEAQPRAVAPGSELFIELEGLLEAEVDGWTNGEGMGLRTGGPVRFADHAFAVDGPWALLRAEPRRDGRPTRHCEFFDALPEQIGAPTVEALAYRQDRGWAIVAALTCRTPSPDPAGRDDAEWPGRYGAPSGLLGIAVDLPARTRVTYLGDARLPLFRVPNVAASPVARLASGAAVAVESCRDAPQIYEAEWGRWCRVTADDGAGWAFSSGLNWHPAVRAAELAPVAAAEGAATADAVRLRVVLFERGDGGLARDVARRLSDGSLAFEEAVRLYSTDAVTKARGGDLGWVSRGDLFPEVARAAFAAPVGAVGGPVATVRGHFVFHVAERVGEASEAPPPGPAQPTPFDVRGVDFLNYPYVSEARWGTARPLTLRDGENPFAAVDHTGARDVEPPGGGGAFIDPVSVQNVFYADVDEDGAEEALVSLVTTGYHRGGFMGSDLFVFGARGGREALLRHVTSEEVSAAFHAAHPEWTANLSLSRVEGGTLVFEGGASGPDDPWWAASRLARVRVVLDSGTLRAASEPALLPLPRD